MRAFSCKSIRRVPSTGCRQQRKAARRVQTLAIPQYDRRGVMLAVCGATLTAGSPAFAVDLTTLYGMATPPTSYGGYGGNSKEDPKYKFDYPDTWKQLTVNKVQKVSS